jgi:hypothetical protein
MSFKDELYIRTYTDNFDKLTKSFFYYFSESDKEKGVNVPKGFVTDYASIPRLALPLIPKIGRTRKAAVLHDWLYSKDCDLHISREKADKIFLDAMRILSVKKWRQYLIYCMVRLFGWLKYKKT